MLLLTGCAERVDGLRVELSVRNTQPVALTTATIALEEVQLQPCAQRAAWWSPLSTAHAHGLEVHSEPRLVHAAMLVDLTSTDVQPLAMWKPPPGAICHVRVAFRPSTSESASSGTTVFLEGDVAGARFRQLVTTQREVVLSIDPTEPNFALQLEATPPPAGADAATTLEQFATTLTAKVVP